MALAEINFDGIVGPSHNYAGPEPGQPRLDPQRAAGLAPARGGAAGHREDARQPRASASPRASSSRTRGPTGGWLAELGATIESAEPLLAANAMSASAMWAANAATVSPAPDTADGRCHLTVANLRTMPHRSHEWPHDARAAARRLRGRADFAVHGPVPAGVRRRGRGQPHAAGRRARRAGAGAVRLRPDSGGPFPARQHLQASQAIARLHRLDPERTLFVEQSEEAIAAGAFHNDVVAVANGPVLFAHEKAFAERDRRDRRMRATAARLRAGRGAPMPKCRWPTRSRPICSTPSWSARRAAR